MSATVTVVAALTAGGQPRISSRECHPRTRRTAARVRLKAEALSKSLDELVGELLQRTLAEDDKRNIDKRNIEEFERR